MRSCERAWEIEVPRMFRPQDRELGRMSLSEDRDGGAGAHDGERAEHRDNQRHSADGTD